MKSQKKRCFLRKEKKILSKKNEKLRKEKNQKTLDCLFDYMFDINKYIV